MPAPNAELLSGVDRIVAAQVKDGAICAKGFGSLDGLFAHFPVWDVLREINVGDGFAGDRTGLLDGEQ